MSAEGSANDEEAVAEARTVGELNHAGSERPRLAAKQIAYGIDRYINGHRKRDRTGLDKSLAGTVPCKHKVTMIVLGCNERG
jgi:hypothetical protein